METKHTPIKELLLASVNIIASIEKVERENNVMDCRLNTVVQLRKAIVPAKEQILDIVSELNASNNTLHRLLKSCVIMLDDGEVTKREVEKQIRYNETVIAKVKDIDK